MKMHRRYRSLFLSAFCVMSFGLAASHAMASTFRLQSTSIVMDERDSRTTFNVSNNGDTPILLLTKLEDLGTEEMAKNVIITPAVTRIDPNQSQIISFSLKQGVKLDKEFMLKASFEGVEQQAKNGAVMPVRQQIGFLLQPKAVPEVQEPWKDLKITASGKQITLNNPGKHVVRMGPVVKLQPSGKELPLAHAYILPGESVSVTDGEAAPVNQVSITPLSRYGLVMQPVTLPVGQ